MPLGSAAAASVPASKAFLTAEVADATAVLSVATDSLITVSGRFDAGMRGAAAAAAILSAYSSSWFSVV